MPKNFMRSKLPISKNKENMSEKLVERLHYCMYKFLVCKQEKISSFLQCVRFIFKMAKTLPRLYLVTYLI